jgi:hypothetical protein
MHAVACSRCGLQRRSSRRAPTRTRTCNGRLYPQMRPGIGWLGSAPVPSVQQYSAVPPARVRGAYRLWSRL